MADPIDRERIARLEAVVANDPGAPEFPALAEALRQSGQMLQAEEVARSGLEHKPGCLDGSVALALVLLDQGRVEDARRELVARAGEYMAAHEAPYGVAGEFPGDVTEGEIERAFDGAELDRDQLVDADRVAHEAIRDAELDRPEDARASDDPLFATQTMANLLERQGDAGGASRIREALSPAPLGAEPAHVSGSRARIIETLENWLVRLRREPR